MRPSFPQNSLSTALLTPSPSSTRSSLLQVAGLVLGVVAAGCSDQQLNKDEGGGGETGTTGTTGVTDPGPDYDDGCILVDGAGGYAWINDAIEVASEGSTIELCAPENGVHEEAVLIDKGVHIVGPGSGSFILQPPVNENGVTIAASNASISGIEIITTRSGVVVGASGQPEVSGVTIDDLKVLSAENWAVSITNAADVTVSNAELMGNAYGAISVDGAEATVTGSLIQNNVAYGIFATGSAVVTATTNDILATQPTDPENMTDGHGIYATDGASVMTQGNAFLGNSFVNVFADSADLEMTDDSVEGALYGVVALQGAADLDGVELTNGYIHAAFIITPSAVTLTNLTVLGDPAVVANIDDATWNVADEEGNATQAGAGILVASDDILLSDSTFTGYNNAGAMLVPLEAGRATVARVSFVDNGRHGLYTSGLQMTLEDVDITGVIEVEEQDPADACLTVDRYAGAVFIENTATWSGGTVSANMGFGISGIRSALNISGVSVAENGCAGIINLGGDLIATGNTFSGSVPRDIDNQWIESSIVDYQGGGAVLTGNLFEDNQRESEYTIGPYDAGSYTYYYVYHNHIGSDVVLYESGPTEVSGNTFVDGTSSVQAYTTEVVFDDNTWTNYLGDVLIVTGDVDVDVTDNIFTDVAGQAVYCSSGRLALEGNAIEGGGLYSYASDYYVDDVFQSTNTNNSLGQAIGLSTCSLSMDGDTIEDRASNALYAYNGSTTDTVSIELVDVSIDNANDNELYAYYAALHFYTYYGVTDILLENVEITNIAQEYGIEIYNDYSSDAYDGVATLTMQDSLIDTTGGYGLELQGDGIDVSIIDSTIANTPYAGIHARYGAQVSLQGVTLSGSGTSNIDLEYASVLTLDPTAPSSSTLAADYGLECDSTAVVEDCLSLDLAGNLTGDQLGCDVFCAVD